METSKDSKILSKEKFLSIIEEMKELHDIESTINDLTRKSNNDILRDFGYFNYLTANESIIIDLLCTIFNDSDIISWWICELDFGRDFKEGYFTVEGVNIDISTPELLYDYLVKNM